MREIEAAIQQRISAVAYRRALADPTARSFIASYGLDRIASWIAAIAVITLSYRLTEDVGIVAVFVLTQVLARLFVGSVGASFFQPGKWVLTVASLARIAALGSLVLVSNRNELGWALAAAGLMAGAGAIVERAQSQLAPTIVSVRGLPVFNRLIGRVEQFGAVVGPLVAGLILFATDERAAFAAATLLLAGSLLMLYRYHWLIGSDTHPVADQRPASADTSLTRLRLHPVLRLVAAGMLVVAALGAVIRVTLVDVVIADLDYASGHYALLLGLVGLGALVGPLPVHKLLGRISIGFVVTGSVLALAVGTVVLGLANHVALVVPVLLASGVLVITCDLVAAVTLRRLIPDKDLIGMTQAIMGIVLAGQLLGLLAVLGLSQMWNSGVVIALVGAALVVAFVVLFVGSNGPRLALATIVPSTEHHVAPNDGDSK